MVGAAVWSSKRNKAMSSYFIAGGITILITRPNGQMMYRAMDCTKSINSFDRCKKGWTAEIVFMGPEQGRVFFHTTPHNLRAPKET
jgi:hypothetical protein